MVGGTRDALEGPNWPHFRFWSLISIFECHVCAQIGERALTGPCGSGKEATRTLLMHHLHTPPPPLRPKRTEINEKLEELVLLCLAKNPEDLLSDRRRDSLLRAPPASLATPRLTRDYLRVRFMM